MRFSTGDWVLGCVCDKCLKMCAVVGDLSQGSGVARSPVKGVFHYKCEHCGAGHSINAGELERFQFGLKHTLAA